MRTWRAGLRHAVLLAATTAGLGLLARRASPATSTAAASATPPVERLEVTSADGTRLHVLVYGPATGRTVVLSHGWTCSAGFWAEQIAALSSDLRVVAYDHRGHGASGPPGPGGFSLDALADDLLAVLEATVPYGQQVVLAGHSMGGFTAIAFAGRHPRVLREKVAAVLLANTAAGDLTESTLLPPGAPPLLRRAARAATRIAISSTLPTGPATPVSRRLLRRLALSRGASDAQVAFAERIVRACPRTTRGHCGAELARMDLSAHVASVDVPALVLIGRADRLVSPALSRRLAAGLPRLVDLVELAGVGHMTPVETPALVTLLIRRLADNHLSATGYRPERISSPTEG